MSFLAMILAVVLERLTRLGESLQRDGWLRGWQDLLRGLGLSGAGLLAVAVLGPALLAQVLLVALAPLLFGLFWIAAASGLLLYSFGRGNFGALQEHYRSQCRREDFEGAWLLVARELAWLEGAAEGEIDPERVHAGVQKAFLYEGYQRWFGVLFYFLLLGPAGALAYRLCHLVGEPSPRVGLLSVIDWLPARALAATFSLAGNFAASADELWDALSAPEQPADEVLYSVAMAATGEDREVDTDAPFTGLRAAQRNEALTGLLRRAAICWVLAISLVVILA